MVKSNTEPINYGIFSLALKLIGLQHEEGFSAR